MHTRGDEHTYILIQTSGETCISEPYACESGVRQKLKLMTYTL